MSKITLEQLIKLHGLKEGDEFTIGDNKSAIFCIKKGFTYHKYVVSESETHFSSVDLTVYLATNEITITNKSKWTPQKGEGCYTVFPIMQYCENFGMDALNPYFVELGCVFKTESDALSKTNEIIKFLKSRKDA